MATDKYKEFLKELEENEEFKKTVLERDFYTEEIKKMLDRNIGRVPIPGNSPDSYLVLEHSLDPNIDEMLTLLKETMKRQDEIKMEILNKYFEPI